MNTALGLPIAASMLIAGGIFGIVSYLYPSVFIHTQQHFFPVDIALHAGFDSYGWLLLPTLSALQDVEKFVEAVVSARTDSPWAEVEAFTTKVGLTQSMTQLF